MKNKIILKFIIMNIVLCNIFFNILNLKKKTVWLKINITF